MSDQHHALFKKMVHQPHVSRLSCGNIKIFIKPCLVFSITSLSLVTKVLRSCVFLIRCLQHLPWGPVASVDTWRFLYVLSTLGSELCGQQGYCLIGAISMQSLQEEQGRWPIPREIRNVYGASSLLLPCTWIAVLCITSFPLERLKKKSKDPPILSVVCLKKRHSKDSNWKSEISNSSYDTLI